MRVRASRPGGWYVRKVHSPARFYCVISRACACRACTSRHLPGDNHQFGKKMLFRSVFFLRTWYNDCTYVQSSPRSGLLRCAEIIPASYGLERKCRLRRRFLSCARSIMIAQGAIQPGIRAAPLRGDYTGKLRLGKKMPPAATLPFLRT